jgi:hypothetical protein
MSLMTRISACEWNHMTVGGGGSGLHIVNKESHTRINESKELFVGTVEATR